MLGRINKGKNFVFSPRRRDYGNRICRKKQYRENKKEDCAGKNAGKEILIHLVPSGEGECSNSNQCEHRSAAAPVIITIRIVVIIIVVIVASIRHHCSCKNEH